MEKRYKIEMEVSLDVPYNAPDSDVEKFIAFELGVESSIKNDNVLFKYADSELSINEFEIHEL